MVGQIKISTEADDVLQKASDRSDVPFGVYKPLVDKKSPGVKFRQGKTLLGERNDIIFTRNEVFQRLFEGRKVKGKHMFA